MEASPSKPQYILAVEQTPAKLKQVIKALSKTMGTGKTKNVSAEEALLYNELTVIKFILHLYILNVDYFSKLYTNATQ